MLKLPLRGILFALMGYLIAPLYAQNALHFDGVDDYVTCGRDTTLSNFNYNITIEAWVYADKWTTNVYEGCIAVKEDNNSNYGYMLRAGNGGRLNFAIGSGTWRELTTASAVMKTGQWYHVAATYDGAMMRLYVDGSAVDSAKETDKIGVSTSTALTIGSHSNPASYARFWSGKIDEVRMWKTTRTAAEISKFMNSEFCEGEKGLVLYYKFNEGTANKANTAFSVTKDYSGKKNDGKLLNFDLIKTESNYVDGVNLNTTSSKGSVTVRKCDSYRLPGSQRLVYQSGTYQETIDNYMGCDSNLTINLTLDKSSFTDLSLIGCDSVASPSSLGNHYYLSGKYKEYLKNYVGCDSVINITVVVTQPKTQFSNHEGCNEVLLPNGKRITKSGTYSDTFMAYGGCDSIIAYQVKVKHPTRDTQRLYLCNFLVSPSDKSVVYKNTGWYYDTLQNAQGCDSFIVHEVVSAKTQGYAKVKACSSYTLPSGSQTVTVSGIYSDVLIGANQYECDSLIEIEVEINKPEVVQVPVTACEVYLTPKGKRITKSDKISESEPSYLGCDSIIYVYSVTIISIDTKVNRDWNTLITASKDVPGASFQWLDCKQNMQKINGETFAEFTASETGQYAVEITQGTCVDTSSCIVFAYTGTQAFGELPIKLYPNPNKGRFILELPKSSEEGTVQVFNVLGSKVGEQSFVGAPRIDMDLSLEPGHYRVKVTLGSNVQSIPLWID